MKYTVAVAVMIMPCLTGPSTFAGESASSAPPPIRLAQAGATLPGGATNLQETFQDWVAVCTQQATTRRCTISQQQTDAQSRQRVLAAELTAASVDRAEGVLVLPFGLALESGVTLQIDDAAPGAPLRFRTCLPAGCVVPISFDRSTIALLRKSTALKIKASADTSGPTQFSISLKGFGNALDRIIALEK